MTWIEWAPPPDEALGPCGQLIGAEPTILRGMPFQQQVRMCDGNWIVPSVARVDRPMEATGTEWTVASLAVVHSCIPDMRGVGRALPPDSLARVKRNVVRSQRAVLGDMPGGSKLG